MVCRATILMLGWALALAPANVGAQETPAFRHAAIELMYPVMVKALEAGRYGQARNICDQASLWEPDNPVHPYNLACIEARAGTTRLSNAFAALTRTADLGFRDLETLDSDPDLHSLRGDPQFALIVARVSENARKPAFAARSSRNPSNSEKEELAQSLTAPPLVQPGLENPINLAALAAVPAPAPAAFASGIPVGLFCMTRPWTTSRTMEKRVWYFAPDGTVYQTPEYGFTPEDLALHAGAKGVCRLTGDALHITWSDGRRSQAKIERSSEGFVWDGGTFVPAAPFPPEGVLAGVYEGGEALALKPNRAPLARTLELRDDGTFYWRGVSLVVRSRIAENVDAASNGYDTAGRWRANGYCLVLVDSEGRIYRRIAFRWKHPGSSDAAGVVFAGTLYWPKQ